MRIVIYIIFIIFCHQNLNAQEHEFVNQNGVLDSVYSKTLDEYKSIYIQVPEGYQVNSARKYPVAYILDGEVFMPTVRNVLDYYSGGFMPEMVLIGISNAENRTRDLTISKISSRRGMPFGQENGEADNFLKFIREELIPFVENKYPVTNYRTLIGHSYAGLFSVYTLFNNPELFANYLAIDPSLDWDNQKILKHAEDALTRNSFNLKALYMSLSGQLHMQNSEVTINNVMQDTTVFTAFARSNISLSNSIKEAKHTKLFHKWQFYPNDLHGTIPLPSIKDGLIALFQWFQMENTDIINNPETSIDVLLKIINHRAEKLYNHFGYNVAPYPLELLNMSGYMNMEMELLEKSKMYFEQAIKYYPNEANTYDSMADYYETIKDYDNALLFLTKAFKISGSDYHKNRVESFKDKKL